MAGNLHNLLTGERGVARVFGPQKGASPEQVEALEAGLVHWAGLLTEAFPTQVAHRDLLTGPGTGASGGLGAGLAAGLGARLCSRFDVLMDADLCGVDLDAQIARADLVITAEGAVDFQTPRGKIPAEVGRRAKLAGKPVIALAGSIGQGSQAVHAAGIDAIMGIIPVPMDLPEAVSQADELVTDAAERALRLILLGAAIAA
ncbi:glycerate kinase [uncultured Actinomyces sp.]|uniref:glycerate kinase n=1 Tax=uncultured Actinomyces sp. TaxID=249061 RepID=UPI0025FCA571|nr:glycerate kinase [uncultured Actinomyces sp.]